MEWVRSNPKRAAAVSAVAVLAVVALVWGMFGGSGASGDSLGTAPLATPTATPGSSLTGMPTPSTGTATPGGGMTVLPGGGASAGSFFLPGLPGGSMWRNLPRHRLVMHVTSEGPIGTVGWYIPTSLRKLSGVEKNVQHEWRLTTTVYGGPDYGRIWLQAGSRGYPITCTITVDGRVTEQRSTDGPYARLLCQG
jgi:hypothetical protein